MNKNDDSGSLCIDFVAVDDADFEFVSAVLYAVGESVIRRSAGRVTEITRPALLWSVSPATRRVRMTLNPRGIARLGLILSATDHRTNLMRIHAALSPDCAPSVIGVDWPTLH